VEVTKQVKPTCGRYQTATQVKGLSPVITNVKEVDSIHELEDNMIYLAMVRDRLLFRGLRPWYDIGWNLQELGRPNLILLSRIFANNPKRRGCGEDRLGVGLTHIRGVAGVMLCEFIKGHSKGLALLR
jgi:hypothetical protein